MVWLQQNENRVLLLLCFWKLSQSLACPGSGSCCWCLVLVMQMDTDQPLRPLGFERPRPCPKPRRARGLPWCVCPALVAGCNGGVRPAIRYASFTANMLTVQVIISTL